jgi:starch phosphorylase
MALKNLFVYPKYPEELMKLIDLSYNLWSLWDLDAVKIYSRIDPNLFRSVNQNPIAFLHSVPEQRLEELSRDRAFLTDLGRIWEKYKTYVGRSTRYGELFAQKSIAYFSMEYGLHHSISNYAGGLGILAGDHLKGVSDLGVPLTGVGLFYTYGYFNQRINLNGMQEEVYKTSSVYYMPVKEYKTSDGKPLMVSIEILGTELKVKVWYVNVGKAKLLLLDTNLDENPPQLRTITNHLYDANKDTRLMQEIVLGFGGMRTLEALGIEPDVFHLNEGHSAFLIVERLMDLMKKKKYSFEEAFALIKNSTVFTTHTPVEAGNENYPADMIKKYLEKAVKTIGLSFETFVKYGFLHDGNMFWLPAFAIRFSRYVNGVSRLHSEVSRNMWRDLFAQKDVREIPIINITNGVHYSWLSNDIRELFSSYVSPDYHYEMLNDEGMQRIMDIPNEEIWDAHVKRKREMIIYLRRITEEQYMQKGFSLVKIKKAQEMLNFNHLTIGFARRFATYKRPTLLIRDRERLRKILTNSERPVQIIFAGKAHPADFSGKNMIKEVLDFAREFGLEDRVIFIENYSREIAMHLVQGVDIWLNTPIKPLEASGTSGMKAGINGVLNLSILDGWWPECYNGKNGWAITAGDIYTEPELRDSAEANQIYDLLEEEIAPLYYTRDERDLPVKWVQIMKESMYTVYKDFNLNRMISEYCDAFYAPALQSRERMLANDGTNLKEIVQKSEQVKKCWSKVYIKEVFADIDGREVLFINDTIHFECYVYLDEVDPSLISVELFSVVEKQQKTTAIPLRFVEKYQDKSAKYEGNLTLEEPGMQSIRARLLPADEDIRVLYPDLVQWKEM